VTGARFVPLVLKQVARHRTRSLLTASGVALAMFLFATISAAEEGVRAATTAAARDTTLVVYRENRFCPSTSRLPEHYQARMERIAGVREVVPIKVVVNNCRAGMDVVTFRGVPERDIALVARRLTFVGGSVEAWRARSDAALVGEALATRRRVRVGETLSAAGVTAVVAGIVRSKEIQDENVAYVQLPFLQRAAAGGGPGVVTQFNVRVSDDAEPEAVARAIDDEFRTDPEPTATRPERAFVAYAARDVVQIVGFARLLGWACLAAVLALVGNAIVLSVQDRIKEHAILQTLGYRPRLIAGLIVSEGLVLSLSGGVAGVLAAALAVRLGRFTMTVEGVSLTASASVTVTLVGLGLAAVLGIAAGLVPAVQASRRPIASCFRSV